MSLKMTIDTSMMTKIRQALPEQISALLRGAANEMVSDMKMSMGTSPAGATYKHGNVSHVASAPGYPPNPDTGALRASINFYPESNTRVVIADGVEYGLYLEIGTERIEPRPFVVPVFTLWSQGKFADFARNQKIIGL